MADFDTIKESIKDNYGSLRHFTSLYGLDYDLLLQIFYRGKIYEGRKSKKIACALRRIGYTMPMKAPRPCTVPGCSSMSERGGRCRIHIRQRERTYDSGRPTRSRRGYNTSHYKLRKLIFAEQPICAWPGCSEPSQELDHINGSAWDRRRENLQGLCKSHHSQKTRKENSTSRGGCNL